MRKLQFLCLILFASVFTYGQTDNAPNFDDNEANAAMLLPVYSGNLTPSKNMQESNQYKAAFAGSASVNSPAAANNSPASVRPHKETDLPLTPICGTKNVGPTGDYLSLTAAFTDLSTNGISCTVNLILESNYVSTVETFPIVVFPIPGTSATYKVNVYPSSPGLAIVSNSTAGTISLDGAQYVCFDGRVNATGTVADLLIENTSTSGYAMQLINSASHNTIKYCKAKGASTLTTNGIISFAGTTETTGNNNNLVDNCEISDGVSSPFYAIYSRGSSNMPAYNSNNTISNCLIHDFFALFGGNPVGIALYASTAWTISGNSFYMASPKNPLNGIGYNMIFIASGDGYTIHNNFIGGSAPNCSGTPLTINGNGTPPTISNFIYGIRFAGGQTTNPSSVQGNTIANIALYTSPGGSEVVQFIGILSTVGIQNISNNVIGSATGTGSISITVGDDPYASTYEGIDFRGLRGDITNNVFGSFTIRGSVGSSSTRALTVRPFVATSGVQDGTITISNNLIGSLTTPNSIQTPVMTHPPVYIQSLYVATVGSGDISVENNTLANISNFSSYSGSYLKGIYVGGQIPTVIAGNTVRDMKSNTTNANSSGNPAVQGIHIQNVYTSSILRSNNIYNLTNTATSASVGINGIYTVDIKGNLLLEKNFIHNLAVSTTSTTSRVYGFCLNNSDNSFVTVKNNMIQLGINPDGSPNTSGCMILGINQVESLVDSILNNSVYIGGAPSAGPTGNTYAFYNMYTPSLSTREVCLGNIFFNARSGGSTGKHYAICIDGSTKFPLGLTSNYNLIYTNGIVGGTFGNYNSVDLLTFEAYKDATGTEMASGSGDPNFIEPRGTSITANLHVANLTPIEGAGIALANVTEDFDGNARSGLTPSDVGADAGNFTLSPDFFSPNITNVPIGNGTTTNRILTNWATITDNIGVSGGASLPRIYYKKSDDANAFVGNTSADNGWKYAVTSSISSPYSFTIDYSILNKGGIAIDEIVQYFVVAQDDANNLSSNYPMAHAGANPPVQNINGCPDIGTIQSYMIVANTIPTIITVPGTYATLTGIGGAFDMINKGVLTGNTIINITADLTEPGTIALNTLSEDPPGSNYTLLIKPDASTLRTISGTAVPSGTAMIRTNGACRFTIDGGTGKLLTFRNTNVATIGTGPTIQFDNGSQGVFLKNCIIENNATTTTYGSINIGSTGLNIVEISGNDIRDATADTPGNMATGIYNSSMASSIKVMNNNIYNFNNYGLYFTTVADGAIITGNSFYYNSTIAATATQICIALTGATNNHTINNNYIGGEGPMCTGKAWTHSTTNGIHGIWTTLGVTKPSTISGNTIRNFDLTNTGSAYFYGIQIFSQGVVNFLNNTIGSATVPGSITSASTGNFFGIICSLMSGVPSSFQGNTVAGLNITNKLAGQLMLMGVTRGLVNIGNVTPNILGSDTIPGSITYAGSGIVYGLYLASETPGNIVENNIIGNWSLTGTPGSPTIRGLWIYSANVRKNKIFNISSAFADLTPTIIGIYNFGANGVTNEYSNNLVSLDGGLATNPMLFGFYGASYNTSSYNLYYNDFHISGPATGTSNTSAFYRNVAGSYTLKNNIFSNARAAGGTGKHYAAYVASTGAWNSNNNDLYSVAGPLGYYNGADQMTIASWKTASGGDANSQNVDPQFVSSTDLHTVKPEINNTGIAIPGITTDYSGVTRGNPPDIGAYEFTLGPVIPENTTITGTIANGMDTCYNATNTITVAGNNTTFEILSGGSATMIAGVKILYLPGTIVHSGGYMWGHIVVGDQYCTPLLAPAQLSGFEEPSVSLMENAFKIYPNPTTGTFTIEQCGETIAEHVEVLIYGILGGKILGTELQSLRKQKLSIKGNPPGIYLVKVMTGAKVQTVKIILTN